MGHSLRKLGLVVIFYLECDFVFVNLTANTDRESSFLELAGSSPGVQQSTPLPKVSTHWGRELPVKEIGHFDCIGGQ